MQELRHRFCRRGTRGHFWPRKFITSVARGAPGAQVKEISRVGSRKALLFTPR
jgi:hypothetical protein